LVIVWALIGIAVKHADTPIVATTAWVMTVIVVLVTALGAWLNRRPVP
jgi:hypothetical protein